MTTVKKLKTKKVYYLRVRAIKKGRKASKYSKAVKVSVFDINKTLKGKWNDVNSFYAMGIKYNESRTSYIFDGKNTVKIHTVFGNDKENNSKAKYKLDKNASISFNSGGYSFSIKCYPDSRIIIVTCKNKGKTYKSIYTKAKFKGAEFTSECIQNFDCTLWNSNYFAKECKNAGCKLKGVGFYFDDDYGMQTEISTSVSTCSGDSDYVVYISDNILLVNYRLENANYYTVVEKTSNKKANAFIIKNNNTYKKEVWTKIS